MITRAFGLATLFSLLGASQPCMAENGASQMTTSLATGRQVDPVEMTTIQLVSRQEDRSLQAEIISSKYTVLWYFVHAGGCQGEIEPTIEVTCMNGGFLTVKAVSQFTSCEEMSITGAQCTTDAGNSTGHAIDFICVGDTLEETMAEARILTQQSDCLGGQTEPTDWGQGIILGLECGIDIVRNGTCDPLNTTFPDNTCTLGYSCDDNCTVKEYVIHNISTIITDNDCSQYDYTNDTSLDRTSGSHAMALMSSVVVAATVTILFGW